MEKTKGILIDTNVFIDHLRNFKPAVLFFDSISEREDVYFSAITETELLTGKDNDIQMKRQQLLQFLNRWSKVSLINPIAELAGDLSRKYNLEVPDAIIAATALHECTPLLTKNIKDFKRVPELDAREPY